MPAALALHTEDLEGAFIREYGKADTTKVERGRQQHCLVGGEIGSRALSGRRSEDRYLDRLQYEIIFTRSDGVTQDQLAGARASMEDAS